MNSKKVFCEQCRKDVTFVVTEKEMIGTLKGEDYNYSGKVAHCTECGSELYVEAVNDYNLKVLYDKYRYENDIISFEKVLKITKKYQIGKRPLSLLLGWGEHTFSRYCDGDMPTKQYSDVLKKIYDEPEYYNQILEKNRCNLKTEATYKKSKSAVEKLLSNVAGKKSKIQAVIEYLLNQCEDITPLALQKSLYYTQGFYYAFYNRFLFSEDCRAWIHGPVYPEIYFRYRDYKYDPIDYNGEIDDAMFSASEQAVLESVVKHICCYSGKILEKFTHSESPWLLARGELTEKESSNKIIDKRSIGEYFVSVKEKYGMINPNDIKSYAQAMFQQV